jgi:hypothetical protein
MTLAGSLLLLTLLVDPDPAPPDATPAAVQSILTEDPALAPLRAALSAEQGPDRLWYWGWSGFLAGVALGQSIMVATTSNDATRINGYVNIPASALGAIAVLLTPPVAAYGLDDVRAMPELTPAQREAKAAALRALFQRSVEQERFYRSALNHVVGLTVNAGLAAILYFGFKLGGRALLTLVGGTLEWEAQIFTRPTHALDLAKAEAHPGSGLQGLHIVPLPNGLALAGSF